MIRNKLKIAFLVKNKFVPKWQYALIEKAAVSGHFEIKLICYNRKSKENYIKKYFFNISDYILDIHLKLDKKLFGSVTNFGHQTKLTELISDADVLHIDYSAKTGDFLIDSATIAQIHNYGLDIILHLANDLVPDELKPVPKAGVLACHYSNNRITRGGPGYQEVINQLDTMVLDVCLYSTSYPNGTLVHRSSFLPDHLSITRTQHEAYWRSSLVILRILEDIYKDGESHLLRMTNRYSIEQPVKRCDLPTAPTTQEALLYVLSHFSYLLSRVWRKIFYVDQWSIFYKTEVDDSCGESLYNYKVLTQPDDRFWADPFVVSEPNRHYLFVEEVPYSTCKGHIAVIEIDWQGEVLRYNKILEKEYHLSYPFLLYLNNTYYMIPETGGNKTVELYRCTSFPYKWEFVMNLMENILTADVTLFFHNNKWWMFCCVDYTGQNVWMLDELHLFYADDLFTTTWISHPCNPIVTDVSKARPAGKIFIKDNKIYRPSQDCSGMYGKAVNINQITVLTEEDYEERLVEKVLPDVEKGIIGTHTYNFTANIKVVDGFSYRRKLF